MRPPLNNGMKKDLAIGQVLFFRRGPLSSAGGSVGTVRRSRPARWVPARSRAGVRQGTAYPLGGGGFSGASGRSAPLPARPRAGARLSLEESRRKEHQGGRGSSSLDPPFLVGGTLRGSSLFFCLACGPVSYARNGPPTGWAGWGGWFCRREGLFSRPKPSPWGEGGPAKPGRMRGRSCTQPFHVEKRGATACRLNGIFLLPRWAIRSPPHPSPSVTASPQGEASGLCYPTRKSVPNQGMYMGPVIAPQSPRCAPPRQNERVETSGS